MAKELAFVLINPYTVAKSRTGASLPGISAEPGLDFVAARMLTPSRELADAYADLIREDVEIDANTRPLLADYVAREYGPDPVTGQGRRVMMLLFEGEDAIQRVKDVTGPIRPTNSGETVRDTMEDCIMTPAGDVHYLEPAVFIGTEPSCRRTGPASLGTIQRRLRRHCGHRRRCFQGDTLEKALVILKPDNFRFASARPGLIIDIFSRSGLRIVGAKIHRMTVAEAEEFYGPVRNVLREKA